MKLKENHEALAVSVYILAMKKQIKKVIMGRSSLKAAIINALEKKDNKCLIR